MKNSLKVEGAIKNLTQEDLEKIVGVSRQAINSMAPGKYVPSTTLALKLSKCFNKTANDIFTLEEDD